MQTTPYDQKLTRKYQKETMWPSMFMVWGVKEKHFLLAKNIELRGLLFVRLSWRAVAPSLQKPAGSDRAGFLSRKNWENVGFHP